MTPSYAAAWTKESPNRGNDPQTRDEDKDVILSTYSPIRLVRQFQKLFNALRIGNHVDFPHTVREHVRHSKTVRMDFFILHLVLGVDRATKQQQCYI